MDETSTDLDNLKEQILVQNKYFDDLEKEYDNIEINLLKKEDELYTIKNEILKNFEGKASSIPEVINYINKQYEDLEKTISAIENQSDKSDQSKIFELLKDVDQQLKKLLNDYSFQSELDSQKNKLAELEEKYNISYESK